MNSVQLQDTRKIQKKIIFLHDSNKQFEDIIRKTFFYSIIKKNKMSRNKSTKFINKRGVKLIV